MSAYHFACVRARSVWLYRSSELIRAGFDISLRATWSDIEHPSKQTLYSSEYMLAIKRIRRALFHMLWRGLKD